jgi:hypothetical protein
VTTQGPRYLFLGTPLDTDLYMPRLVLESLNTWARQWNEELTILDNGTMPGLEHEVDHFKYLTRRQVRSWTRANIVFAFMDRLEHDRHVQDWLNQASWAGIPVYWVSTYHRPKPPPRDRTPAS